MRTATTIEASAGKNAVEFAVEAERLGLDVCWVAEAWGADAPSPLGYLAARTERMLLGSGVIQIGTRSPVTIAQTAMTLAHLSGGRFLLGLGVSGPQVMEGLHGVPFGHPLGRMRETVEIVRQTFTGEKVTYAGRHYGLPLPGGRPPAFARRPHGPGVGCHFPAKCLLTSPITGVIDHISFGVEPWDTDKVKAELERRGQRPCRVAVRGEQPQQPWVVAEHPEPARGRDRARIEPREESDVVDQGAQR